MTLAAAKKKSEIAGTQRCCVPFLFKMTNRLRLRPYLLAVLFAFAFAQACAPRSTPTPFRPPTSLPLTQPLPTTTSVPVLLTPSPTPAIALTTTAGPCANDLTFVDDLTVEDGASFFAGAAIDKQWLVQNSGTCNWDSTYRLKWAEGNTLGAAEEQLIYPARAGTQATLRILFIAPAAEGTYESWWQAYDPNGAAFGDPISIKIVISP